MDGQTAFKLLYDVLYITINRKNEQVKPPNHLKYVQIQKYNFFFYNIRMEFTSQNNSINAFKEARKLFNERRSNLLRKETNEIRKKLYKKEAVYNFLKEKEQEGSLTNKEKKVLKNIDKYLKNFKNDLEKLQKYQYIWLRLFI